MDHRYGCLETVTAERPCEGVVRSSEAFDGDIIRNSTIDYEHSPYFRGSEQG